MTEPGSLRAQTEWLMRGVTADGLKGYILRYHKRIGPMPQLSCGLTHKDILELQELARELLRQRVSSHEYLEFLNSLPPEQSQ